MFSLSITTFARSVFFGDGGQNSYLDAPHDPAVEEHEDDIEDEANKENDNDGQFNFQ